MVLQKKGLKSFNKIPVARFSIMRNSCTGVMFVLGFQLAVVE